MTQKAKLLVSARRTTLISIIFSFEVIFQFSLFKAKTAVNSPGQLHDPYALGKLLTATLPLSGEAHTKDESALEDDADSAAVTSVTGCIVAASLVDTLVSNPSDYEDPTPSSPSSIATRSPTPPASHSTSIPPPFSRRLATKRTLRLIPSSRPSHEHERNRD
jgi:hypothetical protein